MRAPVPADAAAIWQLVRDSGALEQNSCYAYLLVCSHFAGTSLVAEQAGRLVGFVAAYRPPARPDAIFVWQIGVHPDARGRGLGTRMLTRLVGLPACRDVSYLEATVTRSNQPSQRLFSRFAERLGARCERQPGFGSELFPHGPGGSHEDEELFRIGPVRR